MRRHFSLVELMMAVAVLSVLAAIAVPMGQQWAARSRMVEVRVNYDSIWDALVLYGTGDSDEALRTNVGHAFDTRPQGLVSVGRTPSPWDNTLTATDASFDAIGWHPDGEVRCSYGILYCGTVHPLGACPVGFARVHGSCDVDGDRDYFLYVGVADPVGHSYRIYSMGACMDETATYSGYYYNGTTSAGTSWETSDTLRAAPFPDLGRADDQAGILDCAEVH